MVIRRHTEEQAREKRSLTLDTGSHRLPQKCWPGVTDLITGAVRGLILPTNSSGYLLPDQPLGAEGRQAVPAT